MFPRWYILCPLHSLFSFSVVSKTPLVSLTGIASIGLAAAYYSSGARIVFTQLKHNLWLMWCFANICSHHCAVLMLTQTASPGNFSMWLAACLWPCRTWRIGKKPCLTKPRTGLSWKPSACTRWSWLCGAKEKRKVWWRRLFGCWL